MSWLISNLSTLKQRGFRTGTQRFREDHPIAATAVTVAGASLVTAGTLVLVPAIVVGGMSAVGFTGTGVASATGIQSSVYGGLTTGLFSTGQSIGATWAVGPGSVILGSGSVVSGLGLLYAGARRATIFRSASNKTETSPTPSNKK